MRLHSKQDFQLWLARDVEVRDELRELLGTDLGVDLESLDVLEAFLLKRYRNPSAIQKLGAREVLDAAARHIGLVMLLALDGAAWAIELKDADNVYYRLPIIRLADGAEECPLTMVTAALDRRTGNYLRGVVESYA
ncbi:hypothetical protein [Nannocystis sp. SCPEA4]|jgi:hypothetical protein|uniref:hypothetical protein n=1 Tax=Nannocystis sp. SCPEA4 TaxID=2996787 RepID=UPI00226E8B32|nr:hypothetical protein [Nannocystis sp. SCPEA4]MCY1058759.1 hypothetical protein [Nannocystis sp. SCPEA4]